jgi:dimethylargininase
VTHIERTEIDVERAVEQWRGYCDALARCGWSLIEVPAVDEYPDGVFVEDAVVMFGDLAVITRPGAPERRGETAGLADVFGNAGLAVDELPAGDLDGGDVLKIGSTAYVGVGGRTNAAGIEALVSIIGPRGWEVRPIPVTKVLHLKSAVTALPDGTVIGYPPLVDDYTLFPCFLEVPEEHGGHVVLVADHTVLMSTSAPRTAEMLQLRGLSTICVDISEFERLEGCVTCLSVRVRAS